ncbi:proliferation marker protein Ki-67 isoform X2 [Siniperca chuatsi]|uniref:proliferation marker protein Ki-67 isoform X2 n=1 Tax=Siniperca chuatsi TaxID=119488 RepID=UPI001CE1B19C|nr:proliferation marker protein Ki-67 isoform X2 [Siniperca chuatsi]
MPLHGKIVVIKRTGGDGTEFPLTATCLFGRKPDCDIRIQLPQVSKEHCRIDLNENKEVILTNLSSVNPTRVNGEALQQSERLKHGDVITVIDRSFRFEYPPAPTPKKRSSIGGKTETFKVLQDQQVGDTVTTEKGEKRISEVSTDPHLKDGTNHDNIQRSLENTVEVESKEDDSLLQSKTTSPFNDLYQMIKKSLDVKTPRKSSASLLQTPTSRFCTPKPCSVMKNYGKPVISTEDKSTPKKNETKVSLGAGETEGEAGRISNGTPKSVKKQRKSFQVPSTEMARPEAENAAKSEATSPQKRNRATPPRFTVCEVIEQVSTQLLKSPMRRRSKEATPTKSAVTKEQEEQVVTSPKTQHLRKASPRNSGKAEKMTETSKKRKSGELAADLPISQMKRKRVSFGGHLSPELFDKRLPPDSPLRKGAAPRRSLCLSKPNQSLLRRASVIGLIKFEQEHPDEQIMQCPAKMRTPLPKKSSSAKNASPKAASPAKKSPKSRTPSPKAASPAKKSPKSRTPSPKAASPAKKSPKSRTPSPKAASPAKKSPKSRTPSPKAASPAKKFPKSRTPSPKAASPAKKSPKSRTPPPKAASLAKKSPKSRTPSPKAASPARGWSPFRNKVETPKANGQPKNQCKSVTPGVQTPTVQGRFSVSRISTPSPIAGDAVTDQVPLVTPKIPLRRKSTSRKTQSTAKSAVKVMPRRSGISRASMKLWADVVKFGLPKAQVAAPAKKIVAKKTTKKTVSKPQTPARELKGHVSTGHANSPVTIVLSRALIQKVVQPTGAAPRLVTNTALLKKNMKMDEDLTGVSEMFKTPVNERMRRSVINDTSAMKTPVGGLGTSVVEPSMLNTPEEPGEMMVSPLSVSSSVKDTNYNSEAVQRLLQESSFVSDIPALETNSDSSEQQCTDLKTTSVTTPKQKPELPECLTGVKRIMMTPRQKAEAIEDLRGRLLRTPKQKPELQECLTGVKRIMKTPRQKAEPVEDLRGKILKTPKQKPEPQECLTGVKRIMKTPRQKAEPVEDLRGKILKTPKQKPEPQECLTGVKRIMKTPQCEAEPLEDLQAKLLETPKVLEAGDVSLDGVKELVETPAHMQESEDLSQMTDMKTPNMKSSPLVCLTGIKRIMKTPKERSAPVEDMDGVKSLMKTPRDENEPLEENLSINSPVEDFEGLQELVEEPLIDPTGQLETNEVEDQTPLDCGGDVAKELDFAHEEPQDDVPSDVIDVPQVEMGKADANEVIDDHLEEVPNGHDDNESSDAMETISQATIDENLSVEEPEVEAATGKVTDMETAGDPDHEKKSVRGRRAKTVESKAAEDKQEATEHSEDPVVPAPIRGRRGKKTEAIAAPAVRQTTRSRNAKTTEGRDVDLTTEKSALPPKVALKPKRGRNAKKASTDQAETVQEVATETEMVPPESEQSPPVDVANESAAPLEKAVLKPKRGRKAKQPEQSVPEQQDLPCTRNGDVPQADLAKAYANEVCGDQLEAVPNGSDENKSSDAMETVPQAPVTESVLEVETATCKVTEMDAAIVQKKSVRGRRAKLMESKAAEDKQEATEHSEDAVVPAPVRGRRGKKTEATAAPAVKQTTRSRNAKSQESTSDQPEIVPDNAVETTLVSTEAASDQTSPINTHQEEDYPAEEAVVKTIRGRKTKQTPVEPPQLEPEKNEVVNDKHLMAQPQKSIPTLGKPRRGRKTKPDTVEQNDVAEDTVVTVETKQQSLPPVRAKRGRNAKQEEQKLENDGQTTSVETTKPQEPVKKLRTKKAEQDYVEPREVQTVDMVVPEEAEAPLVAEPVKMNEHATVAAKPRRGGRKAKQDTESETPVESTEVQEVPAVSATDKLKRGRRGKQVTEEVGVTTVISEEKPDHELEAEEKNNTEPDESVIKHSRARGGRTVKNEVSQAIPAKRARRGAALPLEETNAKSAVLVSESASTSLQPVKKGGRAAAKPATEDVSDQANPTEDLRSAVVDIKMSKRSVRWKSDLQVSEISKVTPVKAVRGRKSKLGHQVDTESKNVSKDGNKTEEKELSDEVVEAQPVKRARRGIKVADVTAGEAVSTSKVKSVAAEAQPKTRSGKSVKK